MQSARRLPFPKVRLLTGHVLFAALLLALAAGATHAQSSSGRTVALIGNHPIEATTLHPVAHANALLQLKMEVTMALRNRPALDQLLRDQQDPSSPRYHQWLTSQQFTARFGPSQHDVNTVAQWLDAQGFTITASSRAERYVRFTGTVADAERTFGAEIMAFGDGSAYSNVTDPAIPARFAGVIGAVRGFSNFLHSHAFVHGPGGSRLGTQAATGWASGPLALLDSGPQLPLREGGGVQAVPNTTLGGVTAFAPADFRSFYNENPLLSGGITGAGGDCIAIVGDSDFRNSAVSIFNTTFGLPDNSASIPRVLVNGTNPGVSGDELEALLDVEWSHAVAPGAPIRFYLGDNSALSANGSIVDAIQRAVNDKTCGVISVSFGLCGGDKAFYTDVVSPIYAKAAAQGQSIFISSGDDGAAGTIFDPVMGCVPGTSRNINELAGDPNVTQVGGTKFDPNFDIMGNNVGHVPESAWDDEISDPPSGGAGGGGVSAFYSKPSYQKGIGVPADGKRDVPDIALIASNFHPGVFLGFISGGIAQIGCCIGGTSLSAPAWAGISKLIAELKRTRLLGVLNPRIYSLANAGLAASGFRDVTTGDNTFNGVTGFNAGVGFDLTTGWGTVDISTFAHKFAGAPTPTPTRAPTPTPTRTPVPTPTPGPPPVISSVPSIILVGAPFKITGSHFSAGAQVNFFVSTSGGPVNAGPLTPSSKSATLLTVPLPATVTLGQGFVDVQVVNSDLGFKASNLAPALLQGSPAAGIPSLTAINGMGLAATSKDPSFATNNVQTVVVQGTTVALGGMGFDAINGVAVDLFCACPGGKVGPFFVNPGSMLSTTAIGFTLPASGLNAPPNGPGSFVVINKGAGVTFSKSSNAVSVPIGQAISVSSVSQLGSVITVKGTGFSSLTVINFFNQQGPVTLNLGGLNGSRPKIPLTVLNSTMFTFNKPEGSVAGSAYIQALNPPFLPFTSSGNAPGGTFTLL